MITCHELVTTFIADYVEGKLPPSILADFEHHLDVCPSCVAYLRSYRETIALAKATERAPRLGVQDVPEDLVNAILDTLGER